ncbi:hypothetical protein SBA3_40025 [Candidatus Sulfopaludibacter sp. SbA3]|nr:hypothetical protein SBA3_40025 [Candidatus Sulfopaludibacter sp. SbA3]
MAPCRSADVRTYPGSREFPHDLARAGRLRGHERDASGHPLYWGIQSTGSTLAPGRGGRDAIPAGLLGIFWPVRPKVKSGSTAGGLRGRADCHRGHGGGAGKIGQPNPRSRLHGPLRNRKYPAHHLGFHHRNAARILKPLLQEPHSPRRNLVNGSGQFHPAFGKPRTPFRGVENLSDRPAHVVFHGLRELRVRIGPAIHHGHRGEQAIDQYLNPGVLTGSVEFRLQGGLDRPAFFVPEHDKQGRMQMDAGVLQAACHLRGD